MLVAVITALSIDQMHQQMQKANLADAFEWRLDYLTHIDLKELADLRSVISKPVIFTLRRKEEGGKYTGSEEQRLQEIQRLCLLSPDFFDLEWDLPSEFIAEICQKTKVIGSYHNFIKTPDLEKIYAQMQNQHFQQIKIATFAVSTLDQISLLCFLKKHSHRKNLTCISMGEYGRSSRVLGKIYGNALHYACIDQPLEKTGQMSLKELHEVYRFDTLNEKTEVYALLGDPIEQSIGHIWHNSYFQRKKINAVYIKLAVQKEELEELFLQAAFLNIKGFSVTMPLKQAVLPFLRSSLSSCNTITYDREYRGYNTDGIAVVEALEERIDLAYKKVLVLGAGGSARAIVPPLLEKKADVYVWARSKSFALNCKHLISKKEILDLPYEVLIHTTPVGMSPLENESLLTKEMIHKCVVVDLVYRPKETELLRLSRENGCVCIDGEEIYARQAMLQQEIWE